MVKAETIIAAQARILARKYAKEFSLGPESTFNLERDLRMALGRIAAKERKGKLNRGLFGPGA